MKKLNKCIFFVNTISMIRNLLVSIPFSIFLIKKKIIILFVIYVIFLVYEFSKKLTEYFSIRYGFFGTALIIERGIFYKSKLKIDKKELSYIDSIEFSQSFIYKALKKYKVILSFKEEDDKKIVVGCINQYEKNIFSTFFNVDESKKAENNVELLFKPEKKDILLMSFFSVNLFFVFFSGLDFLDNFNYLNISYKNITVNTYFVTVISIAIFIILILVQILRYGNYSVGSTTKYLYKNNGILDHESKELNIDNINTITIYQNIFMKLFKIFNVYCLTTKNDSSKNEFKNMLFPYIRHDVLGNVLEKNINLAKFKGILRKQKYKYKFVCIFFNFLCSVLFIIVLYVGFFYGSRYWIGCLLLFLFKKYMNCFFVSVYCKEENGLCLVIPGVFFYKKVFILLNGIETIKYSSIYFSKKYKVILNSNNLPSKKYVLRGVTKEEMENIFRNLDTKKTIKIN